MLSLEYKYEYHENGLLKKLSVYSLFTGDLSATYYFNNTYRDPLMDIVDTIFYHGYIHPITGEYYPPRRYYYNHHQVDYSYFEEYYQLWDGEKWKTGQKTYVHLLDTATVSEFQHHIEIFDGSGYLIEGGKTFLAFDDKSNVTEALVELYDMVTNKYKISYKFVYLYDDEGKCHTRDYYAYTSSGSWRLEDKLTKIKWFDHHGFDNGDLYFFGTLIGLYEGYSPKNKNKIFSLENWKFDGSNISLVWIDTIKWEIEPFSYYFDHYSNVKCLVQNWNYEYNEHYHVTAKWDVTFDDFYAVPCHSIPDSVRYVIDHFINKYDDRGRRYEYIQNQKVHLAFFPPDSVLQITMTYVVDSFTYITPVSNDELTLDKHSLLIIPNPSSETVHIVAADSIAEIIFYTSDGRLAHSQEGSGKEMHLSLNGLSKGIYIVQARLKNGEMQTVKMVVTE
jgi:hypothetical protein